MLLIFSRSQVGDGVQIPKCKQYACRCRGLCEASPGTFCSCSKRLGRLFYDRKKRLVLEPGRVVYECNSTCACASECANRVVQRPRAVRVSCLHSIPSRLCDTWTMDRIMGFFFSLVQQVCDNWQLLNHFFLFRCAVHFWGELKASKPFCFSQIRPASFSSFWWVKFSYGAIVPVHEQEVEFLNFRRHSGCILEVIRWDSRWLDS